MTDQLSIENINHLLSSNNYASLVTFLEEAIETDPYVPTYYWYLGLAHLLQEKEEEAQATWLLVMSQANEDEIEQWTQALLGILELEAQRQEKTENFKLSWLIRGHIREIEPSLINNLLYLINLEIRLGFYDPECLRNWQIIDYLNYGGDQTVDRQALSTVIDHFLQFPDDINTDFLNATLQYINVEKNALEELCNFVKSTAIELAYYKHEPRYAIQLTKFCLYLKPNDLDLIDQVFWFSALARDYVQMVESAQEFITQAESFQDKVFGVYKLIDTQVNRGAWSEAQALLPGYIQLLQEMTASPPPVFNPRIRGALHCMASPFLYLQDNPAFSRRLHNKLSKLFCDFIPTWIPWFNQRETFNKISPRKLKIGYIAHTLKRHSVGWLSRWLIHYHNKEHFQIALYLVSQAEDDITQFWFCEKADIVHNFPHAPQQIAAQIQKDEIDILIDLDSFSHGVTCQVLALKPAPIQVTWLGFDAAGLPSIDYFIADPYVLPNNAQDYYQETIWRLPQTYLAIGGFEVAVPDLRREDFKIPSDAIIYLTIQTAAKRHPDTIHLQMQILQAVSNSYLLIKGRADQKVIQTLFQTIAQEYGISSKRLHFLEASPTEEVHRANLRIADVILDTYPYNGATTTLEALWMEIPLVTKVGKQFAARNSYTFMINAGLTEGIAWTDGEYIDWGIRLGTDEGLRQRISWKLQQSKKTAPVWNARQFTQEMEKAYQQMWLQYVKS